MNKNKIIQLLPVLCLMNLASCSFGNIQSSSSTSNSENTSNKVSSESNITSSSNKGSSTSSIEVNNSTSTKEDSSSNSSTSSSSSSSSTSSGLSSSTSVVLEKYDITWKNYDGTILEIDFDVPYGTIPTYDGETPYREGTENTKYIFNGWDPSISEVVADKTYTAVFKETIINEDNIPGVTPVLSSDKKTIEYGFYPQEYVSDSSLIASLNSLTSPTINGWYLYEGNYYTKEIAKIYNYENYTFNNNTSIVAGEEYWFKCSPIKWNVLNNNDGTYSLISTMLLDAKEYYSNFDFRTINGKTVYANNYEYSNIRSWLNNEFMNTAFALNSDYLQVTTVDNSSSSTNTSNNEYASNVTNDLVYLASYQDLVNADYGFDSNVKKQCKTTEYSRARGAWYNEESSYKYNSAYWTRSPSSVYDYCTWTVNSGGYLSTYAVSGEYHCVRPCITISL